MCDECDTKLDNFHVGVEANDHLESRKQEMIKQEKYLKRAVQERNALMERRDAQLRQMEATRDFQFQKMLSKKDELQDLTRKKEELQRAIILVT